MEGEGVTNYSVDKPSYSFTAATTQFDDELIRRGIVTKTQALMAKGMSMADAEGLLSSSAAAAAAANHEASAPNETGLKGDSADSSSEDDILDDDDDDFLQTYRQKRLQELAAARSTEKSDSATTKTNASATFGDVLLIERSEWSRHVNDASHQAWVVVCLTSSDAERTGNVESCIRQMAVDQVDTKFILIPSHSAIPNWPHENLPSLFLYRNGKMQHELIRMPVDLSRKDLEGILGKFLEL